MKVICIDKDAWPNTIIKPESGIIENGETYEVEDVEFDDGYIWYWLTVDKEGSYWENCFARVSSIDESEFTRNYQTEKV